MYRATRRPIDTANVSIVFHISILLAGSIERLLYFLKFTYQKPTTITEHTHTQPSPPKKQPKQQKNQNIPTKKKKHTQNHQFPHPPNTSKKSNQQPF